MYENVLVAYQVLVEHLVLNIRSQNRHWHDRVSNAISKSLLVHIFRHAKTKDLTDEEDDRINKG